METSKTVNISDAFPKERPSSVVLHELRAVSPDPVQIFIELNHLPPSVNTYESVTINNIDDFFLHTLRVTPENIIKRVPCYLNPQGTLEKPTGSYFVFSSPNLLLDMRPASSDEQNEYNVRVFYCHSTDKLLFAGVDKFLTEHLTPFRKSSQIGLIGTDAGGLMVRFFSVKTPDISVREYYNDDFLHVHERIVMGLNDSVSPKGVILFHGDPGTGKTTYIRYLSGLIQKQMIFVPQEISASIAAPSFMSLLMQYPNSVLVFEDAENIIKDRNSNGNSPVATILNLSDGLLSDCLGLQIICTFNTDIQRIDKALLRKGRIITRYEFGALSVNKANTLASKNGLPANFTQDVPLSEIFNQDDMDFLEKRSSVGFKPIRNTPVEPPRR